MSAPRLPEEMTVECTLRRRGRNVKVLRQVRAPLPSGRVTADDAAEVIGRVLLAGKTVPVYGYAEGQGAGWDYSDIVWYQEPRIPRCSELEEWYFRRTS